METQETKRTSLQTGEWVMSIDANFHIPIQNQSRKYLFSRPGSNIPVQSTTFWSFHSTHGVHTGGQRGYWLIALQKGIRIHQYLDNWLVRARSCQTCLQQTQTLVAMLRVRLVGKHGEIRAGPKTSFRFRRLPVQSEGGQGHVHCRVLADPDSKDPRFPGRTHLYS